MITAALLAVSCGKDKAPPAEAGQAIVPTATPTELVIPTPFPTETPLPTATPSPEPGAEEPMDSEETKERVELVIARTVSSLGQDGKKQTSSKIEIIPIETPEAPEPEQEMPVSEPESDSFIPADEEAGTAETVTALQKEAVAGVTILNPEILQATGLPETTDERVLRIYQELPMIMLGTVTLQLPDGATVQALAYRVQNSSGSIAEASEVDTIFVAGVDGSVMAQVSLEGASLPLEISEIAADEEYVLFKLGPAGNSTIRLKN
jgi:hypothetical protein